MDRFVARENIKRFKKQLEHPENEQQRAMLQELLDNEEHLLADLERNHKEDGNGTDSAHPS